MIRLLLFIFSLGPFAAFACDADPPPIALEFLKAKHVLFGQAISKVFAKDSLTYTVKFSVEKHFKKGISLPETLTFTLPTAGEITGRYSSCDFDVTLGQRWLLYTYERKGILTFSYYGSNSKPLDSLEAIPVQEANILQLGYTIDYRNILFDRTVFTNPSAIDYVGPSPNIQLANLLLHIESKKYGLTGQFNYENFIASIDSMGNITELSIPNRRVKPTYYQVYDVQAIVWAPLKEFSFLQHDLLQALKASTGQWEPARFMGKAVNSQVHFQVHIDDKGKMTILIFY
ncbi:hypothetical protein [Pontibacter lucknowensis]|uniref:Uncharacterized protein n=1 Tax=Pontibacter lucknowensis TaxID=1077936 RepID=A0A1N6Y9L4_9BACT|nr:hypothetical protein [Pontibacter lucknowensis]SIR11325.1 hypothetical protein SAMN05421545_2364 [Pontibacter lucknowensis]